MDSLEGSPEINCYTVVVHFPSSVFLKYISTMHTSSIQRHWNILSTLTTVSPSLNEVISFILKLFNLHTLKFVVTQNTIFLRFPHA